MIMLSRDRRLIGVAAGSLVTTALLMGSALPADAAPVTSAEKKVARRLDARFPGKLGSHTSGIVLDQKSGRVIWAKRANTGRMPGSVAKLVTALVAMDRLGPEHTVTTRVTTGSSSSRIVLVGAGDELLTQKDVQGLAGRTAWKLSNRGVTSVSLTVDDSLFPKPTKAKGWKSSYYPYDVSPVRALIVDQRAKMDTSLDTGRIFAANLEANGIDVTTVSRGRRPSGATVLASHQSPPVKDWVKQMLRVSDADIAEGLARLAAIDAGKSATWTNARKVRVAVLKKYRVAGISMYDGSGLSRSDRVTAKGVARLLRVLALRPALDDVVGYLPVAGKTGTLKKRFSTSPSTCARGLVRAKTGSLSDQLALAGYARTSGGTKRIFVFLETGKKTGKTTKRAIDGFAATATGCW